MRRIWLNGKEQAWDAATVHVWDETAIRGVSVFEGILAPWHERENRHSVVAVEQHFRRLQRSSSIINLPMSFDFDALWHVVREASSAFEGSHFYMRPTNFAVRGRSAGAAGEELSWFVGAFPVELEQSFTVSRAGVAPFSRSGSFVPPDAKTGGSYLDFRVVEQARQALGVDAILLTDNDGNIVEADGAGVLAVKDGRVIAPLVSGHALDSITRRILVDVAVELGLVVENRPLHWSEAHGTALILAGTLSGVQQTRLDSALIDPYPSDSDIAASLCNRYYDLLTSGAPHAMLTPVELTA